ncbi:hypothetical protein CEXT_5251 [Caerostris extrusa]|uniref:Uncharacterized protein n=1 Tax=Caerostris extrusa TaxID=172846 RepID=A0AAV4Y6U9_CAEEX|nr:hypothetical protein CEXT_5251 [Caerostris extrusa]
MSGYNLKGSSLTTSFQDDPPNQESSIVTVSLRLTSDVLNIRIPQRLPSLKQQRAQLLITCEGNSGSPLGRWKEDEVQRYVESAQAPPQ